ncbi:MAG: trypsin-like peptidase domain-containing protein [Acidobacteriota bacterium]
MLKAPTEPRAAKANVAMILAVCSVVCAPGARALAQQPKPLEKREAPLSAAARARVRKAVASVGLILVRNYSDPAGQNPRPRGSGVMVRPDGIVATNAHVINDKSGQPYDEILLSLSADGLAAPRRYRLEPLVINKEDDLALLRVQGGAAPNSKSRSVTFPAIEIGDSKAVRLLDDIVIIGFPEKGGSSVTVNRGTVEGKDALGRWIKTDGRLIHGNSGGAAVNLNGKLIGIPTKVVADDQVIDKDGDGSPDNQRRYGAVGFLRPSDLISAMLAGLSQVTASRAPVAKQTPAEPAAALVVLGLVRSAGSGQAIAGAVVGLVPVGEDATEDNLVAWSGTDPEGRFKLNKPVPPGRYTLRAKALGYLPYSRDLEISGSPPDIVIDMRPSSGG